MEGIIGIKRLRIHCIIGDLPHERVTTQDLLVDIKVRADFSACVKSDRLENTVDYVRIAEIAATRAFEGKYQLIETFAAAVLQSLFEEFPISWAWIKVDKPEAILAAECSTVELERSR